MTKKVLHRFIVQNNIEVILRAPRWGDLDDLLDYFNSLLEEDLEVLPIRKRMTSDEEADWLEKRLADIEKSKVIDVVAEVDGKVIANSEIVIKSGTRGHVGELGMSIQSGYRNVGIGTQMMKTLIEESRKAGLKVLVLHVFANNTQAIHVYEKIGFEESGRIPRGLYRKGKYIDEVIMTMEIAS